MYLVNDTGAAVIPVPSGRREDQRGTPGAGVSISAGGFGYFVPVLNSPQNYPSTLDWRGAVIT